MAYHLLAHPKTQHGKRYCYYTLSQSFRQEGRVKKRVIAHLGKLTDRQAELIRMTLQIKDDPTRQLLRPSDVHCTASQDYLDIAVFHELWRQLKLDKVIEPGAGNVPLAKLLEIMVINRCVQPCSKLGVTRWYASTALGDLLGVCASAIEESRLYRSLPSIEAHHVQIEQQLFSVQHLSRSSLYFYDLTSSYFEGEQVSLAAFNKHTKDHRPDRLQVVLGLLVDEQGLPFSWEVFQGNQGDAPTLKRQLKKFRDRFNVEQAVLVFDRGFLSSANLDKIEAQGGDYVTGLDAPQIETLLTRYPQPWISSLTVDNVTDVVERQGSWHPFNETQYYCPLGVVNGRQTVLLFDTDRYRLAIHRRQEKIEAFKRWVVQHNAWLLGLKKDAQRQAIIKDVEDELERRHLRDFVGYELHEHSVENRVFIRRKNNPYPSQGYHRQVRSFQIVVQENNRRLLDGLFALITSPRSSLSADAMIHAYRQKYCIEHAFRSMKSSLKLRPWYVYKEEHVRAHYTICVLAYALERMLDLMLQDAGAKEEGWTLARLKEAMAKVRLVDLTLAKAHHRVVQKAPADLARVLTKIGLKKTLRYKP